MCNILRKPYNIETAFILTGIVSLILYFVNNIYSFLFLLATGFACLIMLVWIIAYQRKIGFLAALLFVLIIGIDQLLNSELCKSKILLSAILDDDRSYLELKLRENNDFEVGSYYMFGEDIFKGTYKLEGNKIIFLDKHYNNNFIPDTIYILNDKIIILRFDKEGNPITGFSCQFDIKMNALKLK